MGVRANICCLVVVVVVNNAVGQDYGPVDLASLDALTLSWNQIHWLVRDQIAEVEELKAEHDQIYNQITGCFGLEKCLKEFDLKNIEPGSKLYELGLRRLEVEELSERGEEVMQQRRKLDAERREKERIAEYERKQEEIRRREEALQARIEADNAKETARIDQVQSHRTSSNTMYSSSYSRSSSSSSSSSSYDGMAGVEYEPGLDMETSW